MTITGYEPWVLKSYHLIDGLNLHIITLDLPRMHLASAIVKPHFSAPGESESVLTRNSKKHGILLKAYVFEEQWTLFGACKDAKLILTLHAMLMTHLKRRIGETSVAEVWYARHLFWLIGAMTAIGSYR